MRPSGRTYNELRPISIIRSYTQHAEGSVLVKFGQTHVLCTASVSNQVPRFLKGKNKGWVTAEYGMLPRATNQRTDREAKRGQQTGRTQEIQRLIGRSLRACVNLDAFPERMITIDCDVIQADGGTRTAAITGGCVALADAINWLKAKDKLTVEPWKQFVASVSVGMYQGQPVVDLDYSEDVDAQTDMNIIMTESGGFIEVQGTAEQKPFQMDELNSMLSLAKEGIEALVVLQKQSLV